MLQILKKIIKPIVFAIIDSPPPTLTEEEIKYFEELKSKFKALENHLNRTPGTVHDKWENNLLQLHDNVINDNINAFLRWDVITHTMFATNSPYVFTELKELKRLGNWKSRWSKATIESKTGHPIPFVTYPKSSGNLIHQAYSLSQLEEKLQIDVSDLDFVFEFGGGYGLMCKLFHSLGFKGKYIIFDLPHFSALQEYYLQSVGVNIVKNFEEGNGVMCISDINELSKQVEKEKRGSSNSLFLANWSLSESPLEIRKLIIPLLDNFKNIFIAYQSSFEELDNVEYFEKFKDNFKNINWQNWIIEHQGTNRYLCGKNQ